jgi:phosphopantothenoylcysteine decarboxylase/phosphopantothenate--cysteine ligase
MIRGSVSNKLEGRRIFLGITGSIAAVECVKLARQLIRHGADVVAVMSNEACRFLPAESMKFATGREVITQLSGMAEHTQDGDMLLIAPCTANTISKIALGIADNAVTTFALAFEGKILVAPSMHLPMYENVVTQENIKRCRERGIHFIPPKIEEGKAKMADVEAIVEEVIRAFGDKSGKILIIGGATYQPIDDVRGITNRSTGKMAAAIAMEAYERGMDVMLWASFDAPDFIPSRRFVSVEDLKNMVEEETEKYDAVINCAAISDFVVDKQEGKIKGGQEMVIHLKPSPRINPLLSKIGKKVIAFKLGEENVLEEARNLLMKEKLDYVVANRIESIGSDTTKIWIVGKEGVLEEAEGRKREVAKKIIDLI